MVGVVVVNCAIAHHLYRFDLWNSSQ